MGRQSSVSSGSNCFCVMFNSSDIFPFSENKIEQFGRFIKNMDESVKAIQDRGQVHCEKCQGCKLINMHLLFCNLLWDQLNCKY